MNYFTVAVRAGIEKVAYDPIALSAMDTPDFFRGVHTVDSPLGMFVSDASRRTGLVSQLEAYRDAQAARAAEEYGHVNSLLAGRDLHQLQPGELERVQGHATAANAASRQAARAHAQHGYLGKYTPGSAVPTGQFDAYSQQLGASAARHELENQYIGRYADLAERAGPGQEATGHLRRVGVAPGPSSAVARDPVAAHNEMLAARANAMPGMGPPSTQNAAGGAGGFFKKYKGPLLGGAAVLGGGLLLSNLMKKKDDNVQGPYGPVYR